MKQQYLELNLRPATLKLIGIINEIVEEYRAQDFVLTVRQLYYQLVARDIIPNHEKSYKRLTKIVNDGRLAGLIDWEMIEDRTRDFIKRSHWGDPRSFMYSAVAWYHKDMWDNQYWRAYVIVEKEALVGVLERLCYSRDVPLLAARGYPSASVLREFAVEDVLPHAVSQNILILHLGDHDPSGIDMSRDLQDRMKLFSDQTTVRFKRLALNMNQVEELKPPPNPAKNKDARFASYRRAFGNSCWELDALSPKYIADLVSRELDDVIDPDKWEAKLAEIEEGKERIRVLANSI